MIVVRFTSGLGNQMFQYSLYTLLKEKYPETEVKADVTWFKRFSEHQGYEVRRIFERPDNPDFKIDEASTADIIRTSGRIPNCVKGKAGEVLQFILRIPHRVLKITHAEQIKNGRIEQTGFEDNAEIYKQIMAINPAKDYYITGFFIEEIYYKDRLDKLRRSLRFDEISNGKNAEYVKAIRSTDAVSIHVRRGDYLSAQYSSSFLSLPMDYYKNAVKKALEVWPNAHFFIFSDDKDYISEAFDWLPDDRRTVVDGNTGSSSFRDMQLMSMCRGNIIANSTFSVWAGLLNSNEGARVFYPALYMKEKDSEIKSIPGWIRL